MCHRCEKEVIDQGILESDLPLLPFKWVKWKCVVPLCRGGCRLKDYGNAPFYFDPARRVRRKDGARGGWWNVAEHFYMCGRHAKQWDRMVEAIKHRFNAEYFLGKLVPIGKIRGKESS
jgi:hypothetical protein